MKKAILLLSVTAIFTIVCQQSIGFEFRKIIKTNTIIKPDANAFQGDATISFKVNGVKVSTSPGSISMFSALTGQPGISVTTNMHLEPRTISVNINGSKQGTYPFSFGGKSVKKPGIAYGSYRPDYIKDMQNSFHFESGEFVITSIDEVRNKLSATFFGKAKNLKGEIVEISEGKIINCNLKPVSSKKIN